MGAPLVKERMRHGKYPVPSERADLHWSKDQPELAGMSDGQVAALFLASDAFDQIFMPKLKAIDERNLTLANKKSAGRPLRWSALQLESVFLYRRVAGTETLKEAWARLHSEPKSRLLLGLRERIPSRATLSRYVRQHFNEEERCRLHLELDQRLRQEVFSLDGFDEEARIIGMDGSLHGTHFTPPIPKTTKGKRNHRKQRKIVNAHIPKGHPGAITAPTAGYVGKGAGEKAGQGWQYMSAWTEHGILLGWDISAYNESEFPAAERVLTSYEKEALPHRGLQTLSVLTGDGGFDSNNLRRQALALRCVPNLHKASHKRVRGNPEGKTDEALALDRKWLTFDDPIRPHYSNWQANGHGELRCKCGKGKTKRADEISAKGHLTNATKGCCSTCGNIRITAGKWREGRYPKRWVRCRRGDTPDYAIGNSLTFNDPLAKAYGQDRFGWNESVHATMRKRFGLLKDASWMRDITEVKTEFAIAGSTISLLLLERAKHQSNPASASPPGSASPPPTGSPPGAALPLAA